jgi:hypothetical protein
MNPRINGREHCRLNGVQNKWWEKTGSRDMGTVDEV